MKVSKVGGHDHSWKKGEDQTSYDDKHDHKVSNPKSGWTDYGGDPKHKHQILKVTKK